MSSYERRLEIEREILEHDMRRQRNRLNENRQNSLTDVGGFKIGETTDATVEKDFRQRREEMREQETKKLDMVVAVSFFVVAMFLLLTLVLPVSNLLSVSSFLCTLAYTVTFVCISIIKKKCCKAEVIATVVDMECYTVPETRRVRCGEVLAFTFMGEEYTVIIRHFGMLGSPCIGSKKTIRINPDNPKEIYYVAIDLKMVAFVLFAVCHCTVMCANI